MIEKRADFLDHVRPTSVKIHLFLDLSNTRQERPKGAKSKINEAQNPIDLRNEELMNSETTPCGVLTSGKEA
ncbi:hypothetical protein RRG08_018823 [Elysia crispata]|uniref:Uncharacterized protein n=1 Tax=Elysia crispata TaxID=231223 RepID=A0AAE0ZT00_9GAST|nr:hypothetical protein RRG08_018823 [Elysia crispata]